MILDRMDFKNILDKVSKVKPSKILDVTEFGLLEASEGKLTVTTSNTQTSISCMIEIESTNGLEVLIPTEKLSKLVNSLANGPIELKPTKNDKLSISQGNMRSSMAIRTDLASFPVLEPLGEFLGEGEINSQELKERLSRVVFSAAEDQARPMLQGINWSKAGLASTDGYRASYVKKWNWSKDENAIVPAEPLTILNALLSDKEDIMVKISFERNKIWFEFDGTVFTTTLLSGSYPDISPFFNGQTNSSMELEVERVKTVLRQASTFAKEDNYIIKLVAGKALTVNAKTPEDEYFNSIEAKKSSFEEEYTFGVSCRYFIQAIDSMPKEGKFELKVNTDSAGSPIILEVEDYRHVIMPMNLT